jgi:hypothetical protein
MPVLAAKSKTTVVLVDEESLVTPDLGIFLGNSVVHFYLTWHTCFTCDLEYAGYVWRK